MILNSIMALTLRYFTEFGKPTFQLITASSSIEVIDQKSASITHKAVKLVCITKFTLCGWSESQSYLLLIYSVSFTLRYCLVVMLGFPFTVNTVMHESTVLCSTCMMLS